MSTSCNCGRVSGPGCRCMHGSGTGGAEGLTFLREGTGWLMSGPCCLLCNIRYCYGCRDNGFVKTRYGLCGHAQHFLLVLLC